MTTPPNPPRPVDGTTLAAGYLVGVPLALAGAWVAYRVGLWALEPLGADWGTTAARVVAIVAAILLWRMIGPAIVAVADRREDTDHDRP